MNEHGGDDPTPLHEDMRRMHEGDAPHWASDDWHAIHGFTQSKRTVMTCICGQRVADEIELRVHQHYDHAAVAAAA